MKIDSYDARVVVQGHLDADERRVISTARGARPVDVIASDFSLTFFPGQQGWQARSISVDGPVVKQDNTPGKRRAGVLYWLDQEDTPEWVAAIVEQCRPDVRAPRPRASSADVDRCPACRHSWDDHVSGEGCQAQVQRDGAPYDCNCMGEGSPGLTL